MRRVRRPVWAVVAVAGAAAYALTLPLPWRDPDVVLAPGTRPAMLLAGIALLLVAAYVPAGRTGGSVPAVGLLGATVVAYPTLLLLDAGLLTAGWHVLPLTLVQLAPVLASSRAVGRRGRRWESAVLVVAIGSTAAVGVALAGGPELWATLATLLFAASFLIAPVATWTAAAGTGGETRRRALLAAAAALFPVGIIAWCTTLGFLAAGVGAGDDASVSALLLGFSAGTLLCGLAVAATTAPAGSAVLRTRVVVLALHGLLAVLFLIAGSVVALALPAGDVAPGWALLAGAATTAVLVWPWLRLHGWLTRVVDPSAELRHELALAGDVGDGQHRRTALIVLRRLVEDPDLELSFRAAARTWAGTDGTPRPRPAPDAVVLAVRDGEPAVVAQPAGPDAAARIAALGDLTALLRPALLEAGLAHAAHRADAAAEDERRRIAQDLHDGLQGRLLGLALNLQLSGRDVDDPAARLLLEETVATLRSAVEEVRALGGGRQPELLARAGLAAALGSLFRTVRPVVELDVVPGRFAAAAETTAYYVVGEAVANALKHAAARRVVVRVGADDDAVTVTVTDDGRGGADPRLGSGLRGLAERVAAVGGVLVVGDGAAGGTVVEAVVPCGS